MRDMAEQVEILRASLEDAIEILTLQKLAYQSEAQIYDDWSIPPLLQTFGTRELKGSIYTGNKIKGKRDIRPFLYKVFLLFFSAILFILHSLGTINVNESGIYLLIFAVVALIWGLILLTAKIDNDNLWIHDAKNIRKLERSVDGIGKQDAGRKRRDFSK